MSLSLAKSQDDCQFFASLPRDIQSFPSVVLLWACMLIVLFPLACSYVPMLTVSLHL